MSFNVEEYFNDQANGNLILYYKGNVDAEVINRLLDTVESKLLEVNEQSKLRKKVYNILVESLQNLYHHVDKVPGDFEDQNAEKFAILSVKRVNDGYKITTGNFIRSENVPGLEERIVKINKSTSDEIKELYKFILNHQRITPKGGGGLGLLDIARKTGNKLGYLFREYNNDYSFFYLDIHVNREN